jgi:AcrR family transcriptional regulator
MERKPKRKTRERILQAALMLFNRFGEPSVTVSAIAADMGISHGNLYYHYPSKEKIVEDLFRDFRRTSQERSRRRMRIRLTRRTCGFSCI